MENQNSNVLLAVNNLKTTFRTSDGIVQAVRGVNFTVGKGESLGIVGESGCGKSVTMLSIMRLLGNTANVEADSILFEDDDLLKKSTKEMREIQGNRIGMIFQDPMTSLNPLFTIGDQLMEPLKFHHKGTKEQIRNRALNMMKLVGIPDPEKRLKQYPHEFSGGMRQRVMIAIALCCKPQLLIADEPTTALDVTIQAQILELMNSLKQELGTSIILITHDLGVIASTCSRVIVMYGGLIVESGHVDDIFYRTKHPYTLGLMRSLPKEEGGMKERLVPIQGAPPDLLKPPVGCPFAPRCEYAMKICNRAMPPLQQVDNGHQSACWLLHTKAAQKASEAFV